MRQDKLRSYTKPPSFPPPLTFKIQKISEVGNKVRKFNDGGERIISTGNDWGDVGMSFVPIVGSAMDLEEAIRNPTIGNIGMAALSIITDVFGGSLIKGAMKGAKVANKARKAVDAENKARVAYKKAFRNAQINGGERLNHTAGKKFRELQEASTARKALAPTVKGRGVSRVPRTYIDIPSDNTRVINPYTVYGIDVLLNGIQQYQNTM